MAKKRKRMRGTVSKIIQPTIPREPEKAEIQIHEGEDLYREIRVENILTDDEGHESTLNQGAEVDVVVEADSAATIKKADA